MRLKADGSARHVQDRDRELSSRSLPPRDLGELQLLIKHEGDLDLKLDSHGFVPKLARWEERTWITAPLCRHRGVLRAHSSSFSVRTPGSDVECPEAGVECPGAKREITPLASALELGGASPCSEEQAHLDARRWWDAPSCFGRLGPTVPNFMTLQSRQDPARTRPGMLWLDG